MLTEKQKEEFYIKIYFNKNQDEDFLTTGLKRAYRDFNRTLKINGNKIGMF